MINKPGTSVIQISPEEGSEPMETEDPSENEANIIIKTEDLKETQEDWTSEESTIHVDLKTPEKTPEPVKLEGGTTTEILLNTKDDSQQAITVSLLGEWIVLLWRMRVI